MIQIGKTLYILNDHTYIHCDHDAFEITKTTINANNSTDKETQKIPAAIVEQIIIFGSTTVSSFFIQYCSEHKILVSYVSSHGAYYGGLRGIFVGNVLLRQSQYKIHDSPKRLSLVKNMIIGKIINQKNMLEYAAKTADISSKKSLIESANILGNMLTNVAEAKDIDAIRGIEGAAASTYFSKFDQMIKVKNTGMMFEERSKRPPKNNTNSLLSYLYTLMTINCTAALESFGLDSYMGFLHELRPGRMSLSCDMVEEFSSPFVDRFVLSLINRKQITAKDFEKEGENIRLKDSGKKKMLTEWENFRNEKVEFSLYKKDVPRKLIPYLQSQLLAQYVRGDIPEYPPYIWEET